MDPFSLNLLGYIRQQEILETAAKARHDHRRWKWKISGFRLDMEQQGDTDLSVPTPANGLPLRRWLTLWHTLRQTLHQLITFAPHLQNAPRASAITLPQNTVECVEC